MANVIAGGRHLLDIEIKLLDGKFPAVRGSKCDPWVSLRVRQTKQVSKTLKHKLNPVFNETFKVKADLVDKIYVTVYDKAQTKWVGEKEYCQIGQMKVPIEGLMEKVKNAGPDGKLEYEFQALQWEKGGYHRCKNMPKGKLNISFKITEAADPAPGALVFKNYHMKLLRFDQSKDKLIIPEKPKLFKSVRDLAMVGKNFVASYRRFDRRFELVNFLVSQSNWDMHITIWYKIKNEPKQGPPPTPDTDYLYRVFNFDCKVPHEVPKHYYYLENNVKFISENLDKVMVEVQDWINAEKSKWVPDFGPTVSVISTNATQHVIVWYQAKDEDADADED